MLQIVCKAALALQKHRAFPVKGKDPGHDPVQKISVMGDHNDNACIMIQIVLQDLQGLDVQVVGRFIQHKDIGILHQHL